MEGAAEESEYSEEGEGVLVLDSESLELVVEMHGLDVLLYVVIVGIEDLRQDIDQHFFVVFFEELADILNHLFSVLSVLVDHFEEQNVQRGVILLSI